MKLTEWGIGLGGQREVVELLESSSSRWQSQISEEGRWSSGGARRTLEPRAQPLREGHCCSAELVSLEEWGGGFRWGTLEFRGWEEKTGSNRHCRVRLTGRESQTRKEQSLVSFPRLCFPLAPPTDRPEQGTVRRGEMGFQWLSRSLSKPKLDWKI